MNLLSERGSVCLQEGVHVFPAVEVTDSANLGVNDGLGSVSSPIPKNETLNVSCLDLAAMVDDLAGWRDHDLSRVQ